MADAATKIPFSAVAEMIADKLGVEKSTIKPETILSQLPSPFSSDINVRVRAGMCELMGKYFEARADEVDDLFPAAAGAVHPLSTMQVIMSAETVHHVAEALYDILEKHN